MQRDHHLEGQVFENITSGNQRAVLGNVYETSHPLGATHVDTRPPDYGIPQEYQDHDAGRIDPKDGQEVVDYLNRRGANPDDIGTSEFNLPKGVFYGDLRPRKQSSSAYEINWKRWSPASANSVWYSEYLRDSQRVSQ